MLQDQHEKLEHYNEQMVTAADDVGRSASSCSSRRATEHLDCSFVEHSGGSGGGGGGGGGENCGGLVEMGESFETSFTSC